MNYVQATREAGVSFGEISLKGVSERDDVPFFQFADRADLHTGLWTVAPIVETTEMQISRQIAIREMNAEPDARSLS